MFKKLFKIYFTIVLELFLSRFNGVKDGKNKLKHAET